MRRIPNFILLRAFEAAARLQSFSRAAQELHLTPSAISHQVRELEEYFGRPLFLRRHRRIDITAEGQRLHSSLTRVLDSLEACCSEVSIAPRSDAITLYCAPSFAALWLGPRLGDFIRLHPDITIRLSTGADPIDLAEAQDVDMAVSYGWTRHSAGIDVVPLGMERIVPLCCPQLAAQVDRDANPVTILGTMTLIDSQLSPVSWRDWFTQNGLRLPSRTRPSFDRAALAIAAAADGLGVALESTRLAAREMARGALVEFAAGQFQPVQREIHFLSQRSNQRHIEKIRRFRGWLFEQLDDLSPNGATDPSH